MATGGYLKQQETWSLGQFPKRCNLHRIRTTPYTEIAANSRCVLATTRRRDMSATASLPDSSYILRKLHSLSGVVPVGAFLAEHFWSNSTALVSARHYDETSQTLQTIPFRISCNGPSFFCRFCFTAGMAFISGCEGSLTFRNIRG